MVPAAFIPAPHAPAGPAVRVTCRTARGADLSLAAPSGTSLMVLLRDSGAGVDGACGGNLACATCHVEVAPEWVGRLPPARADEVAMLDSVEGLTPASRLGCQIILNEDMDGLVIAVP
ncbi:2Fe-2S iron-sulfur cluster-binding protein (plasmid) [Roseomonas sp. CCTCC AB2023176]|uniref:2Fe-2S iron-sulfur cluster-binding protein n=1 Tax=Roseomonas sp. CCTCC AB2023176 TaxID=3342640 RepID=UPI0035DFDF2D